MISYSRHSLLLPPLWTCMTKKGSGIDFAFRLYCPKVLPEGVKSFSLETFGKKKKVAKLSSGHSGDSVRIYWRSERKISPGGALQRQSWVSFTKASHLDTPLVLFALGKLHICVPPLAPRPWNSGEPRQKLSFPLSFTKENSISFTF